MTGGASSNYAINAAVGKPTVAGSAIVLLDYDILVANSGETMAPHLTVGARHLGKINVLYADGSVRASWGLSLDKKLNPNAWLP